ATRPIGTPPIPPTCSGKSAPERSSPDDRPAAGPSGSDGPPSPVLSWSAPTPELSTRPRDVVIPPCGVLVFESHHAPGFTPSTLCDPFSKFLLVVAGNAQVRSEAGIAHLSAESLLHVASNAPHLYSEDRTSPVT